MKRLISIVLFVPCVSMAQTFTTGEEFLIDNSRPSQDNSDLGIPTQNNETTQDFTEDAASQENLQDTGSFQTQGINGVNATNDAQGKGSGVQMLGLAMGAAFTATCVSNPPWTSWACPMAAMSFMDSLSGGSAQNAAYQTGTYIDPTFANSNFDPNNTNTGANPIMTAQAQEGLQNLADMGYGVGADGSIMGPDGQSFTTADFASAEALMAKGFTAEQAAAAMAKMDSAKKSAAQKAGLDLEAMEAQAAAGSGAGGLGGAMGAYGADGGAGGGDTIIEEVEYVGGGKNGKGKNRLPASKAAELSTDFNGDPIGISMANLFLIVHKKYKQKKKEKEFFNREY